MKKLIFILALVSLSVLNAQTVPNGMKYQAVARDLSGEVLANQKISLKIHLQSEMDSAKGYYTETHEPTTNQFGLFTVVIGDGLVEMGGFADIPWESEEIWMKIDIREDDSSEFKTISNSRLYAVPYAFHANTASSLVESKTNEGGGTKGPGEGNVWKLYGNSSTDPEVDKLGTIDYTDFVIVTDDMERMRVTKEGQILLADGVNLDVGGNLRVRGDSVNIDKDLFVGRDVFLNVNEDFDPRGETVNYGKFTVMDSTFLKNLTVSDNVPDGGFLATFINTNNGNGDGIKIKLGKDKSDYLIGNLVTLPQELTNAQIQDLKDLISCDLGNIEKINLLGNIAIGGFQADIELIAGLTVGMTNLLIGLINAELGLPWDFPALHTPGIPMDIGIAEFTIPGVQVTPSFPVFPAIPEFDLSDIGDLLGITIEEIDLTNPDFWGIPDICLTDGNSPLNNENEFIQFVDNADSKMGSIRAASVSDWSTNYLNPVFLFTLRGAITSSTVDKKHALYHFKKEINVAIKDYLSLGIEYSSGNGDYAEWLERLDYNESISAGDIVGVQGGKITKDLTHAEQIMAVSFRPIVLGNMPEEGKGHLGNNIAFMGQIPVKIMGPVATGDYIVGDDAIPGYGVAVHPDDMTLEQFKLVVGRAWETIPYEGPKMVNTVVGIHNGDYLKILKSYEKKFQDSENRFESLESKVEKLESYIIGVDSND